LELATHRSVIVAHVKFSDLSGLVTGIVKEAREGDELMALKVVARIIADPVRVHVLSGQKRAPRRRAQRCGDEGVPKIHAFPRNPVDVRSLDERMTGASQRVVPQIVDQYEDEIRPGLGQGDSAYRGAS